MTRGIHAVSALTTAEILLVPLNPCDGGDARRHRGPAGAGPSCCHTSLMATRTFLVTLPLTGQFSPGF